VPSGSGLGATRSLRWTDDRSAPCRTHHERRIRAVQCKWRSDVKMRRSLISGAKWAVRGEATPGWGESRLQGISARLSGASALARFAAGESGPPLSTKQEAELPAFRKISSLLMVPAEVGTQSNRQGSLLPLLSVQLPSRTRVCRAIARGPRSCDTQSRGERSAFSHQTIGPSRTHGLSSASNCSTRNPSWR
jgi:hypothetical protein